MASYGFPVNALPAPYYIWYTCDFETPGAKLNSIQISIQGFKPAYCGVALLAAISNQCLNTLTSRCLDLLSGAVINWLNKKGLPIMRHLYLDDVLFVIVPDSMSRRKEEKTCPRLVFLRPVFTSFKASVKIRPLQVRIARTVVPLVVHCIIP